MTQKNIYWGDIHIDIVKKILPIPVIAIPHHIAYVPNYRGINWEKFTTNISPVVEVYSKHGCAMSDLSPYPYFHTMGPRDARNTVWSGLSYGYKFGFVASTDNHAGYPGSYGDGRLAVICKENTRQRIWDAILARHTYAVTGDKIDCQFYINNAEMGSQIDGTNGRQIELKIRGCDTFDKIIIYKNLSPWKVICGEEIISVKKSNKYKVRIEMGWGKLLNGFLWHGNIKIKDGKIISLESCFRGQSLLSPSDIDIRDTSCSNFMGGEWNIDSKKLEKVMEIYSMHGSCEFDGGPRPVFNSVKGQYFRDALAKGLKLGVISGGDNHLTQPGNPYLIPGPYSSLRYSNGLAAVWCDKLTRKDIFQSLRERYCYATTGARIILDFQINGARMGEEIKVKAKELPEIKVFVAGTDRIKLLEIIRSGKVVYSLSNQGTDFYFKWEDTNVFLRSCYYYIRLIQEDGEMAWSSPIWLNRDG